mgnify:CR=1 FL=1
MKFNLTTRLIPFAGLAILILISLTACGSQATEVPPTATALPASPTSEPTATNTPSPTATATIPPTTTPTAEPTAVEGLETARVGFFPEGEYHLTFDNQVWQALPSEAEDGAFILVSKAYPDCKMYQLLGHGMDPARVTAEETSEVIGGTSFRETNWVLISDGKSVLYSYFWGPNQEFALEVSPGEHDLECIELSRAVVALSEARGFAQP